MNDELKQYRSEIFRLLDAADVSISNIKPSDWVEKNRYMTSDVSPIEGPFSYENSPYAREIVDCLAPDHPARTVAVMKAAQIGFSTGVIEGGIGWIIDQNPGNILFLVGHADLVKDSMKKVDTMIDNSGIRDRIKSTSKRARNTKSGDTDTMKEFPGGYLKLGITNKKTLRNISMMYGFIDDFEGMEGESKEAGATTKMIEQRFAAFAQKKKLFYISTPELRETSNIEPVYEMGDKRKYFVPCPCCGEFIPWEWKTVMSDGTGDAGIVWELDDENELIDGSVGYKCQECGDVFDDSNKTDLIQMGEWRPTAKPSQPGYYSYHISALSAPIYMFGWTHYVRDYMEANPIGGRRDESKWKTFCNLVLGETYEASGAVADASELAGNCRDYEIGIIPERMSLDDGNGKIVMITCGADLGGMDDTVDSFDRDDARLDWEILAHAESGATYSIDHGSIGTFINMDKKHHLRKKYTYKHGAENSVWPLFEKLISTKLKTDSDGREMMIFMTGLDSGYMTKNAEIFADNSNMLVSLLKGDDDAKYINARRDLKTYRQSLSRSNLYLISTNYTKDNLFKDMGLKWSREFNNVQPFGYMNFPKPDGLRYGMKDYFSHYQSEQRIVDKNGAYRWVKQTGTQNHMYDCRLYALIARDIMLEKILAESKIKKGVWGDYIEMIKG